MIGTGREAEFQVLTERESGLALTLILLMAGMAAAGLAIQNTGDKGNDRQAVIDAFFKIKDRDSVLGKYSIDKNGDTTLSDYGADRVQGKKLVFDKVLKAQTAS